MKRDDKVAFHGEKGFVMINVIFIALVIFALFTIGLSVFAQRMSVSEAARSASYAESNESAALEDAIYDLNKNQSNGITGSESKTDERIEVGSEDQNFISWDRVVAGSSAATAESGCDGRPEISTNQVRVGSLANRAMTMARIDVKGSVREFAGAEPVERKGCTDVVGVPARVLQDPNSDSSASLGVIQLGPQSLNAYAVFGSNEVRSDRGEIVGRVGTAGQMSAGRSRTNDDDRLHLYYRPESSSEIACADGCVDADYLNHAATIDVDPYLMAAGLLDNKTGLASIKDNGRTGPIERPYSYGFAANHYCQISTRSGPHFVTNDFIASRDAANGTFSVGGEPLCFRNFVMDRDVQFISSSSDVSPTILVLKNVDIRGSISARYSNKPLHLVGLGESVRIAGEQRNGGFNTRYSLVAPFASCQVDIDRSARHVGSLACSRVIGEDLNVNGYSSNDQPMPSYFARAMSSDSSTLYGTKWLESSDD